jgi:predicted phage baseplate assembly protein
VTPAAQTLQIEGEDGAAAPVAAGDILEVMAPPVVPAGTGTAPISPGELVKRLDGGEPTDDILWLVRDANGFTGTMQAAADAVTLVAAAEKAEEVSEIAFIADAADAVVSADGHTTLRLKDDLEHCFDRAALRINANVAHATHGETVREVLGAGDGSQAYQRFALKQPPLTYVSAATPAGARSTLEVRVNDLLWQEVDTLYGRGPRERVYVTHPLDDGGEGKTVVEFGDGVTGARLPTGRDNVRATYRKGIGRAGLVQAGQLSQLMTAPLGVKSAVNPEAPTGGDDPESLADARQNAPLTVLTLGRAVSLRDYEDFARAFPGVAKALATWSLVDQERRVLITVAGPDGAAIPPDSDTFGNLVAALTAAGDPYVPFALASSCPVTFRLSASLKVDEPTYDRKAVHDAVEQALRVQFSFAARGFAQPVALSEVIAVIQQTPGVVAVDVNALYRRGEPVALNPRLPAAPPLVDAIGTFQPAELLTLDPAALGLEVML